METRAAGDDVAFVALITEVHEAATQAAQLGYPRMARLLDECGFALAEHGRRRRRILEERARRALGVWSTLRQF